jgi:hypothetical protein
LFSCSSIWALCHKNTWLILSRSFDKNWNTFPTDPMYHMTFVSVWATHNQRNYVVAGPMGLWSI